MYYVKPYKYIKITLLFFISLILFLSVLNILLVPKEIVLIDNEISQESFFKPKILEVNISDNDSIINILETNKNSKAFSVFNAYNMAVKPTSVGATEIKFDLFGILPIKTTNVRVLDNREVLISGRSIGVHLNIGGILVLAVSTVEDKNGKSVYLLEDDAIQKGDIIYKVNDEKVKSIKALKDMVQQSKGKELKITAKRDDRLIISKVTPILSKEDNKYHIGLWVRDTSAGIGTLSFYDKQTDWYGALGHGISDIDTGIIMPVGDGKIYYSSILGLRKGVPGTPGEFKGVFNMQKNIGNIKINNENGIYGVMDKNKIDTDKMQSVKIGSKNKIKTGNAYILCQDENNEIKKYDIEINKISKNIASGSKGMVITITDPSLLDKTGGIIQGMSGSPIIQNDMLIGAVTHVFVNDPKKGYGIFIECMLNEIEKYIYKK